MEPSREISSRSWEDLIARRESLVAIFLTSTRPAHFRGRDRARTPAIAARIVARDDLT